MSGADTTHYTARFLMPDLLERARANALRCPIYNAGAVVAPDADGTITIYDASKTAIVDAQPAPLVGGIASYTVPSATLPATMSLGLGWRMEWSLTIAGTPRVFPNDAALVRERLYPVVTDADLFRRHPDLDPAASAALVSSGTNYQDFLDESWAWIQSRLLELENRPNLVMSPSSFREVHLLRALELVFRHFSTTAGDGTWEGLADSYENQVGSAWGRLNFIYDSDDSGQADNAQRRRPARRTTMLCRRGEQADRWPH
jgi:hypothetical protein